MSAVISLFPLASTSRGGWSQQELAEFYRVEAALVRAGLRISSEQGLSDEGEPWFVFCRPDGDEIMHFARTDGSYLIASAVLDHPVRGHDFRALINEVAQRHPELLPIPKAGDGTRLSVHPAALLAALVAAAALSLAPDDAFANQGDQTLPGIAPAERAGSDSRLSSPDLTRTGHFEERDSHRKHADAILLSAMIFAANAFTMHHADARTDPDLLSGSPTDSGTGSGSHGESIPGNAADDVGRAASSSGSLPRESSGPSGSGTPLTASDASGVPALHPEQLDPGKHLSTDLNKNFGRDVGGLDRRPAATASDAPHTPLLGDSEALPVAAEADDAHRTGSSSAPGSGSENAASAAAPALGASPGNGSIPSVESTTFEGYATAKAASAHEAATVRNRGNSETAPLDAAAVNLERAEAGRNGASSEKRGAASETDGAIEHEAAALGKANGDKGRFDLASNSLHSEDRHDGASALSRDGGLKGSSFGGRETHDAALPKADDAGPNAGLVRNAGNGSPGHGGPDDARSHGPEAQAESKPHATSPGDSISGKPVYARAETDWVGDPSASGLSRGDQSSVHVSGSHGAPMAAETAHADANPAGPSPSPVGSSPVGSSQVGSSQVSSSPVSSSRGNQAEHDGQMADGAPSSHKPDGNDSTSAAGNPGHAEAAQEIADASHAGRAPAGVAPAIGHSAEEVTPSAPGGHASHDPTDAMSLKTAPAEPAVSPHFAPEAGTAQPVPSDRALDVSAKAHGRSGDADSGVGAVQEQALIGTGIGDKATTPGAPRSAAEPPAIGHGQSASGADPDQPPVASNPTTAADSFRSPTQSIGGTPTTDQTLHVKEANVTKPLAASVDDGGNVVFSSPSPNAPSPTLRQMPTDDHGHDTVGLVGVQDHGGVHHLDFHT